MNTTCYPLSPAVRKEAIGVLNNTVADLLDVFVSIKQADRNVRGTTFIGMHKLLDECASRVMSHIDLAAERATALGGIVGGTPRESAQDSRPIKREEPSSVSGISDWIHVLAGGHAAADERVLMAIKKLTAAEDFGTADLLTDILLTLDLQLLLLETHINNKSRKENQYKHPPYMNTFNSVLKVVIVHEDLLTGIEATTLFSRMAAQLEAEFDIKSDTWRMDSGIWNFETLRDPKLWEQAVTEAVVADIIIISVGGAGLPASVRHWLEKTLPMKEGGPAALVALLNRSYDASSGPSRPEAYLRRLATRYGLDFISNSYVNTPCTESGIESPHSARAWSRVAFKQEHQTERQRI